MTPSSQLPFGSKNISDQPCTVSFMLPPVVRLNCLSAQRTFRIGVRPGRIFRDRDNQSQLPFGSKNISDRLATDAMFLSRVGLNCLSAQRTFRIGQLNVTVFNEKIESQLPFGSKNISDVYSFRSL